MARKALIERLRAWAAESRYDIMPTLRALLSEAAEAFASPSPPAIPATILLAEELAKAGWSDIPVDGDPTANPAVLAVVQAALRAIDRARSPASPPTTTAGEEELLALADKAVEWALDSFGGYCCEPVDAGISYMQARGKDRWSMQAQIEADASWLPEQALTSSPDLREQGAAEERAKAVAWLRAQADEGAEWGLASEKGTTRRAAYGGGSLALDRAADAIQRGEHSTVDAPPLPSPEQGLPCENCGQPVQIGQVVLPWEEPGEMHADCEHPYSLSVTRGEDEPPPVVLLGEPMGHFPLADLLAPADLREQVEGLRERGEFHEAMSAFLLNIAGRPDITRLFGPAEKAGFERARRAANIELAALAQGREG